MNSIQIREANEYDLAEITQLFYDTIQTVNAKDYSKIQIDDWSSWYTDIEKWAKTINEQFFIVATIDNFIVGFASLARDGYLDFMFVHKDNQRQGIASRLLEKIENKAKEQRNETIYSDVSITARYFFERYGFSVNYEQLKRSRERELKTYKMTKQIG